MLVVLCANMSYVSATTTHKNVSSVALRAATPVRVIMALPNLWPVPPDGTLPFTSRMYPSIVKRLDSVLDLSDAIYESTSCSTKLSHEGQITYVSSQAGDMFIS